MLIKKQKGESDDKLIARFRVKYMESGIKEEMQKKQYHKKPSQLRKEKNNRLKFLNEIRKQDI